MAESGKPKQQARGFTRLVKAWGYSRQGLTHGFRHEAAIRQEIYALLVLAPLAWILPVGRIEQWVLIASVLLVLLVELLNSAIEAVVDRVSTDHHPLSGLAKDMGSAAVLVALLIAILAWTTIAGPLLLAWLRFAR